jgi:hypothetical protein
MATTDPTCRPDPNPPFCRRDLGVVLSRAFVRRLLQTASAFDLNRGGHYDGRSGCVNLWCSPEDKPACWATEIDAGALDHPRAYVGELAWTWSEEETARAAGDDRWAAHVEASPYDLLDHYRRRRERPDGSPIALRDRVPPPGAWQDCLDWCEHKARELLRLAALAPDLVGHACPFCEHVLTIDRLLNELVEHLRTEHRVLVTSVTLGDPLLLRTSRGVYRLRPVESFREGVRRGP